MNFFCHSQPEPDAQREAAWRAVLSTYYEEYGITQPTLCPGGRAAFSEEAAGLLEQFKPAVVSFQFGLPSASLMASVKAIGSTILASATTVEEAQWLERHGVDAIIAQGLKRADIVAFLSEAASTLATAS